MTRRSFTAEQDAEISRRYLAGESTYAIAQSFGTSDVPVRGALQRTGTPMRTSAESLRVRQIWKGDSGQVRDVLTAYRNGESVKALAAHYRCRTSVITDLLAEHEEPLHPGAKLHPAVRGNESRIAQAYAAGASLRSLAAEYGCSTPTIRGALTREGVDSRHGRPTFWTDERRAWVVEQIASGRSQGELGHELGVSQTAVSRVLRAAGVYARSGRDQHGSWKGGRIKLPSGYIGVMATEEDEQHATPNSSGYILEHRLVMGRKLGRKLTRTETVHHINGDPADNREENLQLRQGKHGKGAVYRCRSCGSRDIESVALDDPTPS